MDFVGLDLETANADPATICQIGIATVQTARITHVWTQLVQPAARFDRHHTAIHGITADIVKGAPGFAEIYAELERRLSEIVVTHTRFDVAALTQACRRERLPMFRRRWLDSSRIASIAWPGRFPRGARGLRVIAGDLGITFRHHDAGEDARAAAEIALRATASAGMSLTKLAGNPDLLGRPGRSGRRRGVGATA
ncbi:MAG: exonuclease [Gemmatimonadetes bacterium]|nr:exonuclease [Gemmatimonadota bacterium]MYE95539.1 exonuclease [Gemmatimonadota bacterium]MYJ09118.1 exonuclease [Gemmatimonadota bacterium]